MSQAVPELNEILEMAADRQASDVHIQAGSRPLIRVNGVLARQEDWPVLGQAEIREMLRRCLSEHNYKRLEVEKVLDTAVTLTGKGRFRVNVFVQRSTYALAARRVDDEIPDFETLHLPASLAGLADFHNGLILVTGPTGTGKSSTLAAIINHINFTRECHILCLEDPIEYLYRNERALISQREIGVDIEDFKGALKYAVRQDPDVILVGEMRDSETVDFALRSAETGHLVIGTMHSIDATQTIGRLLNFYHLEDHPQVRKGLSLQLRATVSQVLLPSIAEGVPRVPACELMIVNPNIRNMIARGEDEKIIRAIKSGIKEWGMFDFEQSLYLLKEQGFITREVALEHAPNPNSLDMKFRGIFLNEEGSGLMG